MNTRDRKPNNQQTALVWRFLVSALLAISSIAAAEAQQVVRRFTFSDGLLTGQVVQQSAGGLDTDVWIQVTNDNPTLEYECTGVIRFYDVKGAFPPPQVSGTKTARADGVSEIVRTKIFGGVGAFAAHAIFEDTLSCAEKNAGGGGGGDTGGGTAGASSLGFVGSATYAFLAASTVRITVNRVSNTTPSPTGALSLQLRATLGAGANGPGYVLATKSLGALAPNQYILPIDQVLTYTAPPNGTYYIHLLLIEDTLLADSKTFPTLRTFSSGTSSGGGTTGGAMRIVSASYRVSPSNGTVVITSSISNTKSTTTGALSMALYASTGCGSNNRGYKFAGAEFGTLAANSQLTNASRSVTYLPPPDGTYSICLYLLESPDTSTYVDYLSMGTVTITGTTNNGGSAAGTGDTADDDEGGGSFDSRGLWLLLLVMAVRQLAVLARQRNAIKQTTYTAREIQRSV